MLEAFFSIELVDFGENIFHITNVDFHVFEDAFLLKSKSEETGCLGDSPYRQDDPWAP